MNESELTMPGGDVVRVDEKGYMLDWRRWSPKVAETMAAADGIVLEEDHWAVLQIFRDYYRQFEIEPV